MSRIRWSKWQDGPEADTQESVFVTITHFQARRIWSLPRIVFDGLSLRKHWHERPGAVGVWTWIDWRRRRTGSVSIWLDEKDMRDFVRWPPHVKIVRGSGRSGKATSKSWTLPKLNRRAIRTKAIRELAAWPEETSAPALPQRLQS